MAKVYNPGDRHSTVKLLESKGYTDFTVIKSESWRERWLHWKWQAIGTEMKLLATGYSLENFIENLQKIPKHETEHNTNATGQDKSL